MDPEKISTQLGSIEAKLDRALEDIKEHEQEIKTLNRKVWAFGGILAGLSLLWDTIKHKLFN